MPSRDLPDEEVRETVTASAASHTLSQGTSALDPAGADEGLDHGVARSERLRQEDDLRASIEALTMITIGRLSLEEAIVSVARLAVRAIPGADGAGVTVVEQHRADTVATSDTFVRRVDDIQYRHGVGPCIAALAAAQTIRCGSLGGDRRWKKFGSTVARLGVHSSVSIPLITPTGVVGVMNVYAHAKHAFDDRAAELGQLFAIPAAIAVQTAHAFAEANRLAAQLQVNLDTRAPVERAVGIMISRSGTTDEAALDRLRTLSQHQHERLLVVAQQLVDDAGRRARRRFLERAAHDAS